MCYLASYAFHIVLPFNAEAFLFPPPYLFPSPTASTCNGKEKDLMNLFFPNRQMQLKCSLFFILITILLFVYYFQ